MRFIVMGFLKWAEKRRYPTLFKLVLGLFMLYLFLPDPVPFIDELLLGLLTLLFANLKRPTQIGGHRNGQTQDRSP